MSVDICADDEGDEVEEGYPGLLRQELLGKCQSDRRRDPADLHNGHEACANSRSDLMPCPRTCNHGHRGQIDGVLDRRNLYFTLVDRPDVDMAALTTRLLMTICSIFALKLVLLEKSHCKIPIKA